MRLTWGSEHFTQEYTFLIIFWIVVGSVFIKFRQNHSLKIENVSKPKKTKMNLSPVKLPKNYKGTLIVAFTDINYWPAAKLWFKQISSLNYTNIRLYALDEVVHKEMLKEVNKERI